MKPMQSERQQTLRRVRTVVLTVLGVQVVVILLSLVQGCRQEHSSSVPVFAATNAPADPLTNPVVFSTNSSVPSNNPASSNVPPVQLAVSNPPPVLAPISEYAIVKGDTLGSLAKRFHVSTEAILGMNAGIDPVHLRIGQKLQIPESSKSSAANAATNSASEDPSHVNIYHVKSGDTLNKIAGRFGTTPRSLREANGLATDRINVGQALKIPANASKSSPVSANRAEPISAPPASATSGMTNHAI